MSEARGGAERRRARGRGRRAEALAALYLRLKGYRILARGYRTRFGEIDIVAGRGRRLVIVEVKYRPDSDTAAFSIGAGQRRRIERAAEGYLAAHPGLAGREVRFDAVLMAPRSWPRHIADAWRR